MSRTKEAKWPLDADSAGEMLQVLDQYEDYLLHWVEEDITKLGKLFSGVRKAQKLKKSIARRELTAEQMTEYEEIEAEVEDIYKPLDT